MKEFYKRHELAIVAITVVLLIVICITILSRMFLAVGKEYSECRQRGLSPDICAADPSAKKKNSIAGDKLDQECTGRETEGRCADKTVTPVVLSAEAEQVYVPFVGK